MSTRSTKTRARSLEEIAALLAGEAPWPSTKGTFSAFWMEPVEERTGEWRHVGSTSTMREAFQLLGERAARQSQEWREQCGQPDPMLDEEAALLRGDMSWLASTERFEESPLSRAAERIAVTTEPWARLLLCQLANPVLDVAPSLSDSWSWGGLPTRRGETLVPVLLAEGGAPYDHVGFCVAEVTRAAPKPTGKKATGAGKAKKPAPTGRAKSRSAR